MVKTAFFVDFCRVLIEDFRRFSWIFTDFVDFAHRFARFQQANRFKTRSFSGFGMDPSNFRMKIHEISALGAKRYRNVTKSVPDVKITLFCKVLLGRAQNCIFRRFLWGTCGRCSSRACASTIGARASRSHRTSTQTLIEPSAPRTALCCCRG